MIRLIENEMIKIIYNRKLGFFLLLIFFMVLLPVFISLLSRMKFDNGQTFPLFFFGPLASLVLPVFMAILVADMVTEEYRSGTLSTTLIHPVPRIKVLTAKVITLYLVILLILAYTVLLSYGIGTLFFGWGDRFIDRGIEYATAEGIYITAVSYLTSSLPLLAFGLLVALLAMLFHSSGALVGVAISLVMVSSILGLLETGLEPYLLTTYFIQLARLILFSGSTAGIMRAITVTVLYGAVSFVAAAVIFKRRNILY